MPPDHLTPRHSATITLALRSLATLPKLARFALRVEASPDGRSIDILEINAETPEAWQTAGALLSDFITTDLDHLAPWLLDGSPACAACQLAHRRILA